MSLPYSVLFLSIAAKGHLCPSINTCLFNSYWRGVWILCKPSESPSLVHIGADDPRIPRSPDPRPFRLMGDSHSLHLLMPCLIPLPWGLFGWPAGFLLETSVDRPHFEAGVKGKKPGKHIQKESGGSKARTGRSVPESGVW